MEKHKIIVPKGIKFIREINPETGEVVWKDYRLEDYGFPHILNKKLTGCGYTEYCIKNDQPLILVSPRKFLLENKEDQHPGEVYYVRNELETSVDYELDLSKDDKNAIKQKADNTEASENETITNLDILKKNLRDAIREWDPEKPVKILVTYDSFRHVKDALSHFYDNEEERTSYQNIFHEFQVVVDEFQSIFIDSRFKSDTEITLLRELNGVQKICFVSATPYLDKYLEELDEFKDLPYYELDWATEDPGRVVKPKLEIRFTVASLSQPVNGVIGSYQMGKFDTRIDSKTGNLIESREAVLFFNSVAGICQAIRSNDLHFEECNVLCADTTKNQELVRKAFNTVLKRESETTGKKIKYFTKGSNMIGDIPLKGKPHKMFTFCTRTVYLGADFYSTNARTFIFSDANIECLSVDISMDLEQIIGRQRLDENPWKNSAIMYVKTTKDGKKMTQADFSKRLNKKMKETELLLDGFGDFSEEKQKAVAKNYRVIAKACHYRENYVAVARSTNSFGEEVLIPVFNKLVMITEKRTFEVQQEDYADRFTVFSSVQSKSFDSIEDEVRQKIDVFNVLGSSTSKLHYLLDYASKASKENFENFLELIPSKYKDYYTVVGPEIIKAQGCREADIKKEWIRIKSNEKIEDSVISEIYKTFIVGKKYAKSEIKDLLGDIYQRLGYQKTAKATDLDLFFTKKAIKLKDSSGKWIHGFEIIGKK